MPETSISAPMSTPDQVSRTRAADPLEGPHDDWRDRYNVGGKSLKERPKRIGMAWQQLRATAALVIEWTWVHVRMGWTGRPRVAGRARRHTPERLDTRRDAQANWITRMKQAARPPT